MVKKCRILFLAILVLALSACVSSIPTRAAWIGSHGTRAAAYEVRVWEREFFEILEGFPNLPTEIERKMREDAKPLDAASRKRIDMARAYILARPDCGSCWMWKDVLNGVRDLGTLRLEGVRDEKAVARYFFYTDQLFIDVDDLAKATTEEAAAMLVHELTHRAAWNAMKSYASFTRDEMVLLLVACTDFWQRDKVANEGLAYWNQVTWTESAGLKTHGKLIPGTLSWVQGDRDVRLNKLFAASAMTPANASNLRCGPPVIIRGPHRGTYFDPVGLAPEFLTRLFADVFGSM